MIFLPHDQQTKVPGSSTTDAPKIRTVFSTDDSLYQSWQAEWLAWSFNRVGQPGYLTRLWSGEGVPTLSVPDTYQTRAYSPHPRTGDVFACYNKPLALQDWLENTPSQDETILLIDPDFIFLKPISLTVLPGDPIAERIAYMDTASHSDVIRRNCDYPDKVQSLGVPILIHRYDLERLVPSWVEKTEAIRNNPADREQAGWLAEMWGYVIAAADLGIEHRYQHLAAFQMDRRVNVPFIHYCYESRSESTSWQWDKRAFEPSDNLPAPPDDVPRASKILMRSLRAWIESRATSAV